MIDVQFQKYAIIAQNYASITQNCASWSCSRDAVQTCQLENYPTACIKESTYYELSTLNGVSSWPALPLSPKLILPIPSLPKHMEKEFEVSPLLDKMLGTDVFFIPSPKRPLGAAASRNDPV